MNYFKNEIIESNSNLLFSSLAIDKYENYSFDPIPIYDYLVLKEILELRDRYIQENGLSDFNEWITKDGSHAIMVRQNIYKN